MISGFCLEVEEKGSGSLLGLGTIFRAVKEDLKALQGKEKRTMVAIGGGGLGKLNCLESGCCPDSSKCNQGNVQETV